MEFMKKEMKRKKSTGIMRRLTARHKRMKLMNGKAKRKERIKRR